MAEKRAVRPATTPEWVRQLTLKLSSRVSQVFVLTGNTRDIVDHANTLEPYLTKLFVTQSKGNAPQFDLVIFYDRANGLRFALPEMREKFESLVIKPGATAATGNIFGNQPQGAALALPRDPDPAFAMVEQILKMDRKDKETGRQHNTVFIIDHAETLFPAGSFAQLSDADRTNVVRLLNWAKDPQISEYWNPVILITDTAADLHSNILASSSRIEQIEILLPTPEERLAYIEFLDSNEREANGGSGGLQFASGFDARKFSNMTAGLTRVKIEDIKLTAQKKREPISPEIVKNRKREIFKQEYQSVLEINEPEFGFEAVGGLDYLKEFHRLDVIQPMVTGDLTRCPMGLLYMGSPGTCKSWFAKALAKESGMNMVRLDIGKLLGGIVGESEHNMLKALLAIRSLTPVIVFIDEIDQAISRGSHGDSGVSNRLFKMMLEFMSDNTLRGRCLFIAATNRPDSLDPALKRTGRFDKKIAFLEPDELERELIFKALLGHMKVNAKDVDFTKLAQLSEGWVGSDIEAALVKAYSLAGRAGRKELMHVDLEQAIQRLIPSSHDRELWSKMALLETSDTDLLPPRLKASFDKKRLEQDVIRLRNTSVAVGAEKPRQIRDWEEES